MDPVLRRARWAVSIIFAINGFSLATWLARIPAVQHAVGISTNQLGIGLFGLACGSVFALIASGPLITTIGSKTASWIGLIVLCVGLALIAFAPNLAIWAGVLVIFGLGNGLLDVAMNAHAARVEAGYQRPIFAAFHAMWSLGGAAGAGCAVLMEQAGISVTTHFPVAGLILLVSGLWTVHTGFLAGKDAGQGYAAFALPHRSLLPLCLIAFCGFVAEGGINSWGAVYLVEGIAATPSIGALGYAVFSISMIVTRLIADNIVQRIGTVRYLRRAAIITVIGFCLALFPTNTAIAVIGFGIIGLGVAGVVPIAWSAASRSQPESPGKAIAVVATFGYFGSLAEPLLIGGLTNLIDLRWALSSAALIVAGVFFLAPAVRIGNTGYHLKQGN